VIAECAGPRGTADRPRGARGASMRWACHNSARSYPTRRSTCAKAHP